VTLACRAGRRVVSLDATGIAPSCPLRLEQLDAAFLGTFIEDLERDRCNSIRTRDNRLSALHAFFRHVSLREPAVALHCQRASTTATAQARHDANIS
jgi:hypothetical protein